jgi:enolase-phosphatase E1
VSVALADRGVRLVLLDIEGTTTPMAFVHDVLFPYARQHAAHWLEQYRSTPEYAAVVAQLSREHAGERERGEQVPGWPAGANVPPAAVLAYVGWLMNRDRKSPGLKQLQGLIWEQGYQAGDLHGIVYPDVPRALRRWRDGGLDIAIYSSGSELAQRRLFASTEHGDLTPLLSAYFDTAVGPKVASSSYARIADSLDQPASSVLFVSDVVRELDAAAEAGCQTVLSVRPGNADQPDGRHERIASFDELI